MAKEKTEPRFPREYDAFQAFVEEFARETDRAAVVLGAARLDAQLYQLISKVLAPCSGSNDELLDGDSPLATLSAKINIAYRLGLIDAALARARCISVGGYEIHLRTRSRAAHSTRTATGSENWSTFILQLPKTLRVLRRRFSAR